MIAFVRFLWLITCASIQADDLHFRANVLCRILRYVLCCGNMPRTLPRLFTFIFSGWGCTGWYRSWTLELLGQQLTETLGYRVLAAAQSESIHLQHKQVHTQTHMLKIGQNLSRTSALCAWRCNTVKLQVRRFHTWTVTYITSTFLLFVFIWQKTFPYLCLAVGLQSQQTAHLLAFSLDHSSTDVVLWVWINIVQQGCS